MVAYSFKRRFVLPIQAGLGLIGVVYQGQNIPFEFTILQGGEVRPFDSVRDMDPPIYPKTQTIRARGLRRHAQPGQIVQLYHGMRTKHCFKIGEAPCTSNRDIYIGFGYSQDVVRIFGAYFTQYSSAKDLDEFSRKDGFQDWNEMKWFWSEEHPDVKDFHGVLIEWEKP